MSVAIDIRQQLLNELNGLSPQELEKIYHAVAFLKEEFMASYEARYYTSSWITAEQEATLAHQQGGLKSYSTVDDMISDILSEGDDQ